MSYPLEVRTGAIDVIIKSYATILDALEEIHHTAHDEYGVKAAGLLATLDKFETFFGLKLGHQLFGAAEEVSKVLQTKDLSVQEAVSSVSVIKQFYKRLRRNEEFDRFFDHAIAQSKSLRISELKLPRYRKAPRRLDEGSEPHRFNTVKDYFRCQYFEACDLLVNDIESRLNKNNLWSQSLL